MYEYDNFVNANEWNSRLLKKPFWSCSVISMDDLNTIFIYILALAQYVWHIFFAPSNGVFTLPDSDSYANADTDNCAENLQWMSMGKYRDVC